MKVPKKHVEEYYEFNEVMHYLEKKHGKNFRDYANKFGKGGDLKNEYLDFWHYVCDRNEIHNGGTLWLPDHGSGNPPWVEEILGYFEEFLGEDYHDEMRVSW